MHPIFLKTIIAVLVVQTGIIRAGPPFVTDDPEPVAYHHWEFYLASQVLQNAFTMHGTIPQIEINFGVLPETQLHIIAPFGFSKVERGTFNTGPGDVELGIKFRFLKESKWVPQAGVFPHVLLPTGDTSKGLGAGYTQLLFPMWLQKSFGSFTTYGGGGYWINPGHVDYNFWTFGWELQYGIIDAITVGVEIFHNFAAPAGGQPETGLNAGTIININRMHHVLVSAGTDIKGPNRFMTYAAYQLTL